MRQVGEMIHPVRIENGQARAFADLPVLAIVS